MSKAKDNKIYGNLRFYVSASHVDYKIAFSQCNEARRLFNTLNCLYLEKQKLKKDSNYVTSVANELGVDLNKSYEDWRKIITQKMDILLPEKVGQHVRLMFNEAWSSVWSKRKKLKKSGVDGSVGDVGFVKNLYPVRFTNQAISRNKKMYNNVIPSGWTCGFELPEHVSRDDIQAATLDITPDGFELNVLYRKTVTQLNANVYKAAIDFGLDNIVTLVTTDGSRPKVVDGRGLKSINQYFNKKSAEIQSKEFTKGSRKLKRLWYKRNKQVNHILNSMSNEVIRYLLQKGINELVIGWNDGFKDSIKLGNKTNQKFVMLPHARLRDMLMRKCHEVGIIGILQEESYTSKASFIDNDVIPVYSKTNTIVHKFSGKRISRGEYRSKNGIAIHADVNAAFNILHKSNPSIGWSSWWVAYPERLKFVI